MSTKELPSKCISVSHIVIIALVYQIMQIPILWGHTSTGGTILGRYSNHYALFLMLSVAIFITWIITLWLRRPVQTWLTRLPIKFIIPALVISGVVLFWLMQQPFEPQIRGFLGANWLLLVTLIVRSQDDAATPIWYWRLGLFALLLMLIPITITAVTNKDYSPDEGIWADVARSYVLTDSLHFRTGYAIPYKIAPGLGWFHAIHGAIQWQFDYQVWVGRLINLGMYLLGIGGIGLLTQRLYGPVAATSSMAAVFAGSMFFRAVDYRPDHFLPVFLAFALWAVINGLRSQHAYSHVLWHGSAGLIATLSMQIHAVGITFVLGLSLFYTSYVVWDFMQGRRHISILAQRIFGFGIGAGLGTMLYYIANILPVGGINIFLSTLVNERGGNQRHFDYLISWSNLELLIIYSAVAFLLWRRSAEDKLYLFLMSSIMLGILIADTQGYAIPYRPLFLVPIGTMLAHGFQSIPFKSGYNRHMRWVTAAVIFVLLAQSSAWINWDMVRRTLSNRSIPEPSIEVIGREVAKHIQSDETVVGTHELVWAMPEHRNFYSPTAEGFTKTEREWHDTQVWDILQPDAYIQIPQRLDTPPGLQSYLEREGFFICEDFQVVAHRVLIHRRIC